MEIRTGYEPTLTFFHGMFLCHLSHLFSLHTLFSHPVLTLPSHTSHSPLTPSFTHLRCGRPVRLMLDRHEDMVSTGTRHPFLARYKVHTHVHTHYKVHSSFYPSPSPSPSPLPPGGVHQGGHPEGCSVGAVLQQRLHAGPLRRCAAPCHVACGQRLLHPPLAGGGEELQDQCPLQHCLQRLWGTPGDVGS